MTPLEDDEIDAATVRAFRHEQRQQALAAGVLRRRLAVALVVAAAIALATAIATLVRWSAP